MRRRKWLWIGAGAICALAVLIGYLVRPLDRFAALRKLAVKEEVFLDTDLNAPRVFSVHRFYFDIPIADVRPLLPGSVTPGISWNPGEEFYDLPDGASIQLLQSVPFHKCLAQTNEQVRPWYQQAWSAIKIRLGMSLD